MPKGARIVVTGFDTKGKPVFTHDTTSTAIRGNEALGTMVCDVWRTDSLPAPLEEDDVPKEFIMLPEKGGLVFRMAVLPPMSVYKRYPEETKKMYPKGVDDPDFGMHTTETIDYTTVISGEVWAVLEGGEEKLLKAGDLFIQRGTNHAWRNKGDKPCVISVVMADGKGGRHYKNPKH